MLEITITEEGTVRLTGRLDASQANSALARLEQLDESVTADLSGLDYISSAGLAVILATYKRLTDAGHHFRLTNVTPRVYNVFRYAGLDKLLGLEPGPSR